MHVPGSLERCIRILIHWNTTRSAAELVHVYIRGAKNLRPDHAQLIRLAADTPPLSS
jgi:chorismate mutase